MKEKLEPAMIDGTEFSFYDGGGCVVASVFGKLCGTGDYVGIFNSRKEAVQNLKKANIIKIDDNNLKIENLIALDEKQFI